MKQRIIKNQNSSALLNDIKEIGGSALYKAHVGIGGIDFITCWLFANK